jgi:formylglycine-generating enzyme required for sulfatase activity
MKTSKRWNRLCWLWVCLLVGMPLWAVDPVVSNVRSVQRPGTRLVDITYDVADSDSPTVGVAVEVSADSGVTYTVLAESFTGDVGNGIKPGTGKRVVWDAKADWPNKYSSKVRFRVLVSDQWQWLAPAGMALIPAGPFQMGDDRVGGATPVHTVTVSAFAMDKWEVSIELWESVRAWGNAHGYDLVAGGSFGAKHPVHTVNWWDVVKWNNARSEKEGKVPAYYEDVAITQVYRGGEKAPGGVKWDAGYRLPTEAEWEKAARGGVSGKLYPWGTDEISTDLANYKASNKGKTMPIGSYGANGYGLYDMVGNVWEWTWDWYGDYAQTAQTDPRGPSSGSKRVIRGCSWINSAEECRVALRYGYYPGDRDGILGFRSVLPLDQP